MRPDCVPARLVRPTAGREPAIRRRSSSGETPCGPTPRGWKGSKGRAPVIWKISPQRESAPREPHCARRPFPVQPAGGRSARRRPGGQQVAAVRPVAGEPVGMRMPRGVARAGPAGRRLHGLRQPVQRAGRGMLVRRAEGPGQPVDGGKNRAHALPRRPAAGRGVPPGFLLECQFDGTGPHRRALFYRARLQFCRMAQVRAEGARFLNAALEHCAFWRSRLDGARFGGAQPVRHQLRGMRHAGLRLPRRAVAGSPFYGQPAGRARFGGARCAGADFRRADLRGARELTLHQLLEARTDQTTILPWGAPGPAMRGMR